MTACSEMTHSWSTSVAGLCSGGSLYGPRSRQKLPVFTVDWFRVSFPVQLDEELSPIVFPETKW